MTDMNLPESNDGADGFDGGGFDPQSAMDSLYGSAGAPAGQQPQEGAANTDEGIVIEAGDGADAETIEAFSGVAGELGLTSEQAQAIADKMGAKMAERQTAATEQAKYDLAQQAGKQFGKDLPRVVQNAQIALRSTGQSGKALADMLDSSGLGSHPVVLQFLADLREELR